MHSHPVVQTNEYGLPKIKYMLMKARQMYPASIFIYINSDILINPYIFPIAEYLDDFFGNSTGAINS